MTLLGPVSEASTTLLAQHVADWDRTQPWQKSLDAIINGVVPEIHPAEDEDLLPVMGYITKEGNIAIDEPRWDMATVEERRTFLLELVKDIRLGEAQPRDRRGRFASYGAGGGGGVEAAFQKLERERADVQNMKHRAMGKVDLKEGQTFDSQAEADDAIRANKYEAVIITRPGGKPTVLRTGVESSVSLDDSDRPVLNGAVVTHNHPAAAANPALDKTHYDSFSPPDVASSIMANVAEARVVTPYRTFSLKPKPEEGWTGNGSDRVANQRQVEGLEAVYEMASIQAEFSGCHPLDVGHVTNIIFARDEGFSYTVTNKDGSVEGPDWPEVE